MTETMSAAIPGPGLIDPRVLMRIRSLELRARIVVEGFWKGLHRSPYHGFSVEFTEYRQYVPGDDPRTLDWKLYARSDRYYVKRFEDETNLRCDILLDASGSMSYGSVGYTKSDYARTLAASLAYLLNVQRDAVGLVTFDDHLRERIPARYRPGQLRRILHGLENTIGHGTTDLKLPLEQIPPLLRKRGMLLLISDLLADVEWLETRLGYLTACGHEVLVLQVLDPAEVHFAFETPVWMRDVETGCEMYVDPELERAAYRRKLTEHCERVRAMCSRLGIGFHQFTTESPLELALFEFLCHRMHVMGTARAARRRSG